MGTITKALKLLNHFSLDQGEIGLTTFQALSEQNKATVYRHLCELQKNGFVEQDSETKKYRLGPALLRLATVREQTFPMIEAVSTIVDKYSRKLGELIHVSLYEAGYMSPLYHADIQPHGTRVYFDEGELLPMHATSSGLSMLAFGNANLLTAALKKPMKSYTGQTINSLSALKQKVRESREQGFSICSEGFEKEVFSIAMPIYGDNKNCLGTIAVALPLSRLKNEVQDILIADLKLASDEVSTALGGQTPLYVREIWET